MTSYDLTSARWFKSSYSNGQNNCVEAAFLGGDHVALRDSKQQGRGPILTFTHEAWTAFLASAVCGEFSQPR